MAKTTGLWQKGHEEILKAFVEKFSEGCAEVARVVNTSADILNGKDKNNDTEALESMYGAIVGYCNGQLNMMKDAVGNIVDMQAKAEEEKGSQCGYAEFVRAALNNVEEIKWAGVELVVGGEQVDENDESAIKSTFRSIADVIQEFLSSTKASTTEMIENDTMYSQGVVAFYNSVAKVFVDTIEYLKAERESINAIAEDARAIVGKVGNRTDDVVVESSAKATESARSMAKGLKPMADDL